MTCNLKRRLYHHRYYHNRNTDDFEVLQEVESKKRALEIEFHYQFMWGSKGANIRTLDHRNRCRLNGLNNKGRSFSEEVNKKKGRSGVENSFYGKKHSDDAIKRMKLNQPNKKPLTLKKDSGDIYFNSLTEAAKYLNSDRKSIRQHLTKPKTKGILKGVILISNEGDKA